MLTNRRQLAAKIEGTPGIVETLAAADAKILAFNQKTSPLVEMNERNPVKKSLGRIAQLPGKRARSCTFDMFMGGSGSKDTLPEWGKLVRACAHKVNTLYTISIGAVTGGPFLHGEAITGGTSGVIGRVIKNTADGASAVLFVAVGSGTLESGEVITGAQSGATATTSSIPSTSGKVIEPESDNDNIPTLTIGSYEDGIRKLLQGSRGKVHYSFETGKHCTMGFEFNGVEAGLTDLSMLTRDFGSVPIEPAFLNAAFTIDDYAAKFNTLDIDVGAVLAGIDDPSAERGLSLFKITDRPVTGSFDPLMVLVATHDIWGKWFAGTEMVLDFILGATTGNKFEFYAARCQYIGADDSDRDGNAAAGVNFQLNDHINMPDTDYAIILL